MRNLIKMNFYRLSRSMSAYIIIFIVILECFMMGAVYHDNARLIISVNYSAEPIYEFLNLILSNNIILCFPLAGIALFITAQYKSGFIKNFAGNYPERAKIIGADIIVSCAYSLILLAAAIGATYIVGLTFNRDITTLGQLSDNLDVILPKIMPYLGFSMLAVFISEALRSATFTIIGGFALILLSQVITSVFDYALHKIGISETFSVGDYFMINIMSKSDISDDALRIAIVGAVYFAVFAVITIIMSKKRDIV